MAKRKSPIKTVPAREARINIRVQDDLREALVDLARDDRRSLSAYVERVLEDHVRLKSSGRKSSRAL